MTMLLPQDLIEQELRNLPEWNTNHDAKSISKEFVFQDFSSALAFVNKVGEAAEQMNHHPDVELSYGKVKVTLSTHSAGGLTEKDFLLAKQIEDLSKE